MIYQHKPKLFGRHFSSDTRKAYIDQRILQALWSSLKEATSKSAKVATPKILFSCVYVIRTTKFIVTVTFFSTTILLLSLKQEAYILLFLSQYNTVAEKDILEYVFTYNTRSVASNTRPSVLMIRPDVFLSSRVFGLKTSGRVFHIKNSWSSV